MSQSELLTAATILAGRRIRAERGALLPAHCRPSDIETALAIQSAVTVRLGERIAGWKCGMPAEGRVVVAPIHAGALHAASPCVTPTRAGQVRIEPELAFVLGHDLPPRDAPYAADEVDAAVVRTHLALELIGSRYADPDAAGFPDHLADGLFNQGLFLGPQVDDRHARACGELALQARCGADNALHLDGHHPAVDPRAPLYWLAEFLRGRGQGLQAGQAVITGAYVAAFDVPAGTDIAIRFGDLGELAVRFIDATGPART